MKLKKLIIINGNSEVEATIKKVVKDDRSYRVVNYKDNEQIVNSVLALKLSSFNKF